MLRFCFSWFYVLVLFIVSEVDCQQQCNRSRAKNGFQNDVSSEMLNFTHQHHHCHHHHYVSEHSVQSSLALRLQRSISDEPSVNQRLMTRREPAIPASTLAQREVHNHLALHSKYKRNATWRVCSTFTLVLTPISITEAEVTELKNRSSYTTADSLEKVHISSCQSWKATVGKGLVKCCSSITTRLRIRPYNGNQKGHVRSQKYCRLPERNAL